MKKTILSGLLAACVLLSACSGKKEATEAGTTAPADDVLVIYTYDSFMSEWGPAGSVIPPFEEKYGIKVEMKAAGDAGQMLSRLILEKDNPAADIVIGLDNNMLSKARKEGVLEPYVPSNAGKLAGHLVFDPEHSLTAYDYGYFAINYDSTRLKNLPSSLEDLTKPEYKDSLILMDPRTSSVGLGFLLWTVEVYGDGFTDYWKRLMPSVLTISDGWDTGYGLFTSGEAPMVLSYTTSPPYHVEYEDTDRFRALIFDEGNYMQIEGAGIVRNAAHREAAEKFMDYILTDDFQKSIALTNFMMPSSSDTELPDSFVKYAPVTTRPLLMDSDIISEGLEKWLEDWREVVTE